MYLVGSDYVFPRVANAVIADQLAESGVAALGERYLPLEAPAEILRVQAETIVADIRRTRPRLVVSTLNGLAGNMALFGALRASIPASELPSISFSIGAPEAGAMARLGVSMAGDYAGWTWLSDPTDRAEAKSWAEFGAWASWAKIPAAELPDGFTDPMVSALAGVRLWAGAYAGAGAGVSALRRALAGRSAPVPGGRIFVDEHNLHVWKPLVIGQFGADSRLPAVFRAALAEQPLPFPAFRTRVSWERVLREAAAG